MAISQNFGFWRPSSCLLRYTGFVQIVGAFTDKRVSCFFPRYSSSTSYTPILRPRSAVPQVIIPRYHTPAPGVRTGYKNEQLATGGESALERGGGASQNLSRKSTAARQNNMFFCQNITLPSSHTCHVTNPRPSRRAPEYIVRYIDASCADPACDDARALDYRTMAQWQWEHIPTHP